MTDIARMSECSQSTVSVVLNNTPGIKISKATRERVVRAAKKLGYETGRTRATAAPTHGQIAIIYDRIATSPEAVISIDGAHEAASATGHVLAIYQTLSDPEIESRTLDVVLGNGVEAIIFASIMTRKIEVPSRLYSLDIPVVLLNCYTDDHHFPTVLPGEVAGGHTATNVLVNAGHRRIALITGEMWMDAAKDRLRGYRDSLATADIPYDPDLVKKGNWQTSAGYECTQELLKLKNPPTAIFCSNDRMAVGAYEAIKEFGLRIPADISIIGYDDEEVSRHLAPQLSTLVLPHREMGRWAVEKAFSSEAEKKSKYPLTKLECPYIERASIRMITPPA
ncbi:MAG: LacI family DNA-binding transcriptional regulator [Rhodospirillales bacterium]|nr:LacI family DNA-binding transcriptional regulator [Rhodospirillales bacterium]